MQGGVGMNRVALLSVCLLLAAAACDASGSIDAGSSTDAMNARLDASGADSGPNVDAGSVPVVPDPGTGPLPFAWADTEPNDTPEQAVRIGLGSGQIGPYIGLFEAPDGHLGGGDEVDYFVFRTAAGAESSFIAGACWDPALNVNLLDHALYKVIDGQPLILVKSTSGADTDCEVQEPFQIPLEPDSKYLFVVTHVDGEGDYNA